VLQCAAVCCSVLQCAAVCCSVLQCAAVCCSMLQCVAVCCSVLQCVAVCCSVLQCVVLHTVCRALCLLHLYSVATSLAHPVIRKHTRHASYSISTSYRQQDILWRTNRAASWCLGTQKGIIQGTWLVVTVEWQWLVLFSGVILVYRSRQQSSESPTVSSTLHFHFMPTALKRSKSRLPLQHTATNSTSITTATHCNTQHLDYTSLEAWIPGKWILWDSSCCDSFF